MSVCNLLLNKNITGDSDISIGDFIITIFCLTDHEVKKYLKGKNEAKGAQLQN